MKVIDCILIFKAVFLFALCILLIGCKNSISSDLIVFDVNGNFPVKTLDIQEVADIEYLTLEIDDEYLFKLISICSNIREKN